MRKCLYTPSGFKSRYGLLGTFVDEIARAAQRHGWTINPLDVEDSDHRTVLVTNNVPDLNDLLAKVGNARIVNLFVDHPLTARFDHLKILQGQEHYHLITVTPDDLHMLNLRFPALQCRTVMHGVDRDIVMSAEDVADSYTNGQRDIDVLYCGSIASEAELAKYREVVPAQIRPFLDDMVQMRLACPSMSLGQVWDACVPFVGRCSDYWSLMCLAFLYVNAAVGRETRLATVKALAGQHVTVVGTSEWEKHCTGTIKTAGEISYAGLHRVMRRAKVCLCNNPPQFVMGISERILMAMASGCAVVCDERLEIDRLFHDEVVRFLDPKHAALVVERLQHGGEAAAMGIAGAGVIAKGHTWDHRIPALLG